MKSIIGLMILLSGMTAYSQDKKSPSIIKLINELDRRGNKVDQFGNGSKQGRMGDAKIPSGTYSTLSGEMVLPNENKQSGGDLALAMKNQRQKQRDILLEFVSAGCRNDLECQYPSDPSVHCKALISKACQYEFNKILTTILPDKCWWDVSSTPKVITAPGCTQSAKSKICVGTARCETRGGNIQPRFTVCSVDNCADVVACVKDGDFSSSDYESEVKTNPASSNSSQTRNE